MVFLILNIDSTTKSGFREIDFVELTVRENIMHLIKYYAFNCLNIKS